VGIPYSHYRYLGVSSTVKGEANCWNQEYCYCLVQNSGQVDLIDFQSMPGVNF
jgi:hypothetical protein